MQLGPVQKPAPFFFGKNSHMTMQNFMAAPAPSNRRRVRYPNHPFQLRTAAFGIYPFMIAPVLPGETLKSLNLQARVVTDPIKNPLCGWWLEYYFFYVKLTDLYAREDFRDMLLDPAYDVTVAITNNQGGTTTNMRRYFPGGAGMINYVRLCERVCIDHYFRDEDDTYANYTMNDGIVSDVSLAQVMGNNVFDSATLEDTQTALDVAVADGSDANATLDASEVHDALMRWQQQKLFGLTELSYEDWLEMQGIRQPGVVEHRPELIRYSREWQYPTNTIDPTNGAPRSAVSWSIRERADKPRFFSEPGFIFGLTVMRPKVYLSKQEGTFTALMNDYKAWMPSFLHQADHNITRKKVAHDVGPLATIVTDTDGYWVDLKDLLLYGEQFYNYQLDSTVSNLISLPSADLTNKRYLPTGEHTSFFVTPASAYYGKHDGVVSLGIANSARNPLIDTTPRGGVRSDQTSGGD